MNPTVTQDMSILSLITNASVLVQLVMAALLLASLFSWYYIFLKTFPFKRATRQADEFEKQFWSGGDLNELYQRAAASRSAGTLERIFEAGFREFAKLSKQPGMDVAVVMDGTRRAMRATYQREMEQPRIPPVVSRLGRLGEPLRRPVRHGVGDHERVSRPRERRAGDAGPRRAGHRRSADRHRHGSLRRDSRR